MSGWAPQSVVAALMVGLMHCVRSRANCAFFQLNHFVKTSTTSIYPELVGCSWAECPVSSGGEVHVFTRWAASLHDKARSANIPYLFRQVSAPKSEWGINTLGLYLADRDGITVNPETVHPIREFPVTDLPLMPHDANKGRRFTAEEWKTYKETKGLFRKSAKRKISALEAQGFLNQRIPEFT